MCRTFVDTVEKGALMLTKKQLDLLDFINKRVQRDGVPPSFDEMKEALDLRSKSGIHRLITALEERGFIRRLAHKARALEIIKLPDSLHQESAEIVEFPTHSPQNSVTELPMMGRIAAGVPIAAIAHASHNVSVPPEMLRRGGTHYALEVRGDSMIEAGINDGDVVVICETSTADDGDIVVALVEDQEATLKKFYRRNGMIALEAANPAYETRMFPSEKVRVQGRLIGLLRTY